MTPTDFKFTVRGKRLSSIGIMSVRGVEDVDTYEGSMVTHFVTSLKDALYLSYNHLMVQMTDQ